MADRRRRRTADGEQLPVDTSTAMAAMRVSSLDLVLKTDADERLRNVSEDVNALPAPIQE